MADRMIRDELLTSQRYWAVSMPARQLFIHLMLSADDFGCYTGANFAIRARCLPVETPEPETVERMLQELVDQDLIRLYAADGARYVWIPRFRQRMRTRRHKYPTPPFSEFSQLSEKMSDMRQTDDGHVPVPCQAHAVEVKGSEVKGSEGKGAGKGTDQPKRSRRPTKISIPSDFSISPRVARWAAEKGHQRLAQRFEHFVSACRARGYEYVDWDEAFMTAVRDDWAKLGGPQMPGVKKPVAT